MIQSSSKFLSWLQKIVSTPEVLVAIVIIISIETPCPDFIVRSLRASLHPPEHLDLYLQVMIQGVWRTTQASCSPSADPLVSRAR